MTPLTPYYLWHFHIFDKIDSFKKKKKDKRRQFASSKNCLNCLTNHPPDIKTSWRRSNDFSLSVRPSDVAGMSQVKHPTTSRWNVTKTFQSYVSTACYWNVVTTSQKDLTTKSHQYVSTTSQKSLKWNTQRRHGGTLPRRLSGTYPRCPISTSLRRLL